MVLHGPTRARLAARLMLLAPALLVALANDAAQADMKAVRDPASYVNPLIGTAASGNVFPGAVVPYGMIGWSPVDSASGGGPGPGGPGGGGTPQHSSAPGASGTYTYDSTRLRGFSLTHFSGAGCPADSDIPIMPIAKAVTTSPSVDEDDTVYGATYSHANETATAGEYQLKLDTGVDTDISVTKRAGYGQFTFPAGSPANVLFRVSNSDNGSTDASVTIDRATNTVSGQVTSGGFCSFGGGAQSYYTVYFTAKFDQPIKSHGTWVNGDVSPGSTSASGGEGLSDRTGKGSGGWVGFDTSRQKTVGVRVGLSYVSADNAAANLAAEIPSHASFGAVKANAHKAWSSELSKIQISGGSEDQRTVFYTALYHAVLQPQLYSDVNGQYTGADGATHRLARGQRAQYSTFSGWDVYRGQVQLSTLIDPQVGGDFAQSLLNFADQRGGEWERWLDRAGKTAVMVGDPSAQAVPGIFAFGGRNFDASSALDSLVDAATKVTANDVSDCTSVLACPGQRPGLDQYLSLHYVSAQDCHCGSGASETLEDSQADFALAQLARALGRKSTYTQFLGRGEYWRNLFNPNAAGTDPYVGVSGWIQNRNLDGSWAPANFDPVGGGFSFGSPDGFTEGNSAKYTWMTYDDVAGLIDLMGGKDKALARLDTFFHVGSTLTVSGGGEGRFDASNEPDIQTPWLYDYMGAPSKTQETVRAVVNQLWTNTPSGITGNDDLGTMSAWNVWASLGMYPQVPSRADLVLASPLFPHIVIHRGNGKTITIDAPGANADTKYVKSLTVNGRSSDKPWLSSSLVSHGGRLRYGLQTTPSSWGSDAADAPPSLSNPPTIDVTHAGDAVKVRAGDTMSGLDGAPSCTVDGQSLRLRPAGEDTWTAVVRSRGSHTVRCTTTNVFGTSTSASDVVEGRARS